MIETISGRQLDERLLHLKCRRGCRPCPMLENIATVTDCADSRLAVRREKRSSRLIALIVPERLGALGERIAEIVLLSVDDTARSEPAVGVDSERAVEVIARGLSGLLEKLILKGVCIAGCVSELREPLTSQCRFIFRVKGQSNGNKA